MAAATSVMTFVVFPTFPVMAAAVQSSERVGQMPRSSKLFAAHLTRRTAKLS